MSSVLSSYRQKAQTGKYLLVTGTPVAAAAYTVASNKIPTTVVIADSGSSEAMVDSDGVAGTTAGTSLGGAGALLLDLGREAVIYDGAASISGVTSPYYKRAIYRQVAKATAGAGFEGAPGSTATTYWVKVWSSSGVDVIVTRV
jgi:hypothetical protein